MATKKLYINSVERPLKPGYTIRKNLNTMLDTALVIIPQVEEFAIEPLDKATLEDRYFYVSTIRRKIASFTPVRTYNYEIGLISPTIYLQRVILPNRSVTQRFKSVKLSIYDVMVQYVAVYAPTLSISSALQEKTENIDCPDFQWTQPTLYEVFNDLLRVVNSVVTMTNYTTISYLDLATRGAVIDTDIINNMEVTQSIDEYASKLEIDAKNTVYPERNIQTYERLVLKTTQLELMTHDNAELILAKPVYTIDKIDVELYDNGILRTDFTDRIVERTVYNSYRGSNTLDVISAVDYKRNAVYYTEGSNIIGGFGYNEDGILGINTRRAIINIITDKLGLSPLELNSDHLFEMTFRVWYTSTEDIKMRVESDKKNASTMINNQETSHADLRSLARSNQDTVNRIGNPNATIYGRVDTEAELPEISDTMDDYVLTSLTVRYNVDYFEFTGELTENYVMENMFTAIKNRKRYQQYESANQAFLSEHITEYNIIVSTSGALSYLDFETFLIQFGKKDYQVKAIVANLIFSDNSFKELILNHSSHWLGTNAVRLNIRMDDNFSAGIRLERGTVFLVADRYSAQYTSYVDANGEFEAVELLLYKAFENPNLLSSFESIREEALDRARQLPLISDGLNLYADDIIFDTDLLYRYKDNREITSETLQFYFKPASGVFIGDAFYRHNPLVYQGDEDIDLYVYTSTSEIYEDGDQEAKGTQLSGVVRSFNGIRSSYNQTQWDALTIASWCVADSNGNMYLATNGNARTIYLRSEYAFNPFVVTIDDIEIMSVISAEYVKGNDVIIDDIEIVSIISSSQVIGNDVSFDDVDIHSVISYYVVAGDSVTINDVNIRTTLSATYEYNADHFAITDIDVNSIISATYDYAAPDSASITDINVATVISATYDYEAPLAVSITDINIATTLSATYDYAVSFVVRWENWNGTLLKTEYVTDGSYATAPSNPTRTQDDYYTYTFLDWNYDWEVTPITANTTITATYSQLGRERTVSFNADGGIVSPLSKTVRYGDTLGTLPTPTKSGYTFSSWRYLGNTVTSSTVFEWTTNITLIASYTANSYTVTFNSNGGSTPSPTSKSVTFGSTYGTLATTTRTNHTFLGWYTASTGGTLVTSSTTVTTAANHILYAQWADMFADAWQITANTAYEFPLIYETGDTSCRTQSEVLSWLTANYDPTTYLVGQIVRVRVITSEAILCGTYYYEAVEV